MTGWRIIALAPAEPLSECRWEEAANAAGAIAAAHDSDYELILLGPRAPTGVAWPNLSRFTLVRTATTLETPAQVAAAAAGIIDRTAATLVILPPGPVGEEIAAGLAAMTRGKTLGRARRINLTAGEITATRSVFGGRAEVSLTYPAGVVTAAIRCPTGESDWPPLPSPDILDIADPPLDLTIKRTAVAEHEKPLEGAQLVVSGGRGLDEQGFGLIREIADALGAAVGGSLPAVDAGLVSVDRQVGQSGKFVTPQLYVAVGISGTPQHFAGISTTSQLIAINTDPTAPIFSYAELGAVIDARDVLPLIRELLLADPAVRS